MGKPVVVANPVRRRAWRRPETSVCGLYISNVAFGGQGVLGEQSVVVEQHVDFDGALGGALPGPVEDLGAQVDDGAVQTIELAGDHERGL
jgi:hypothetical protein